MTPEEIALRIVRDDRWFDIDYVGDDDQPVPDVDREALAHDIAAMIRSYGEVQAAAQRERDAVRLAEIAAQLDQQRRDGAQGIRHEPAFIDGVRKSAAAIRVIPPPTQEGP